MEKSSILYEMGGVFEKAIRKGPDSTTSPKRRLYTKKFWTVISAYVSYTKRKNKPRKKQQDEAGRFHPSRLFHGIFVEFPLYK